MAAEAQEFNPTNYIGHHLTFWTEPAEKTGFWTINVDSMVTSIVLGVLMLWFLRMVVKGATSGVPGKRQAFVEILFDFVDEQVKGIFHGDRSFVSPVALTVMLWVLLMNAMDFLPVDIVFAGIHAAGPEDYRLVPTADVNTTFALALSVWLMMIYYSFKVKGFGGFFHELFCAPFGSNPLLWIFNLLFNLVEYISKPLSHSLRLYGNMYAGEIIFLLLWLLASVALWGTALAIVFGVAWAIFHILIVGLQAYIFMMLTIVYISMAHESH